MSVSSTGLGHHETRAANGLGGSRTYSVDEAAELLGVSRFTAYAAIRGGTLPAIRIGKRILVPKVALDRMLNGEIAFPGAGTDAA